MLPQRLSSCSDQMVKSPCSEHSNFSPVAGVLVEAIKTVSTIEREQLEVDFAKRVLWEMISKGTCQGACSMVAFQDSCTACRCFGSLFLPLPGTPTRWFSGDPLLRL